MKKLFDKLGNILPEEVERDEYLGTYSCYINSPITMVNFNLIYGMKQ